MSYTCKNGPTHQHTLAYEGRVCYGLIRPPAPPAPPVRHHEAITEPQMRYIGRLGGDQTYAAKLTKQEASEYITRLQKGEGVTQPARSTNPAEDPRLQLLEGLLPQIRDGYYATQMEEGAKINFIRISTPKRKTRSRMSEATRKIQTQHGPRLEIAAAIWPDRRWSLWDQRVIDMLMLLVVDPRGCLMRYSRELNHCCKCNTELTDERSRHYGIGPDCEKLWPDIIEEVDAEHDGKPFELLAR